MPATTRPTSGQPPRYWRMPAIHGWYPAGRVMEAERRQHGEEDVAALGELLGVGTPSVDQSVASRRRGSGYVIRTEVRGRVWPFGVIQPDAPLGDGHASNASDTTGAQGDHLVARRVDPPDRSPAGHPDS